MVPGSFPQELAEAFEEEGVRNSRDRLLLAAAVGVARKTVEDAYEVAEISKYTKFSLLPSPRFDLCSMSLSISLAFLFVSLSISRSLARRPYYCSQRYAYFVCKGHLLPPPPFRQFGNTSENYILPSIRSQHCTVLLTEKSSLAQTSLVSVDQRALVYIWLRVEKFVNYSYSSHIGRTFASNYSSTLVRVTSKISIIDDNLYVARSDVAVICAGTST